MVYDDEIIKIPILGLDNAGKTSLLHALQREFSEIHEVQPTKRVERVKCNFFDKQIIAWDFGGQDKYRDKYTKKAANYFSDIGDWFYVVDVLDYQRYDQSFEYFTQILHAIVEHSPGSTCNVLINKLDPGSEHDEGMVKLYKQLHDEFVRLSSSTRIKLTRVHQTTIENPISVIRAFSKPLFQNLTLYDNFTLLFKEIVDELGISFIICFTQELLEIGNYFSPFVDQKSMREIAMAVFNSFNDKTKTVDPSKLSAAGINIEIIEFLIDKKKYLFTYGYPNDGNHDKSTITMKIFNLLEDIKKFMSFLN